MAYNNLQTRVDVAPLIPESVRSDMLTDLADTSVAMTAFRRIPVTQSQTRFPILSALPIAYWVAGDTGLKQTTELAWGNKYLNVEELAVIAPIPERVLDDLADAGVDGGFNIWDEIRPTIVGEMARVLDQAVFFGINAPATFPLSVLAAAEAVLPTPNTVTEGSAQNVGGIQNDIDEAFGIVEAEGFDPDTIIANRSLRGKLRRARNTLGERLEGLNPDLTEYLGVDIAYPMRGMWPVTSGSVEAFVGEFKTQFVIGVRQDITMKFLDQAVIQDNTGAIIYNLPQQDMVAMRFTLRVGWQVANPIRYDQPDPTKRYPVAAVLLP